MSRHFVSEKYSGNNENAKMMSDYYVHLSTIDRNVAKRIEMKGMKKNKGERS